MATQYDDIGISYNEMRQLPGAKLIDQNVKTAVSPYIEGAKVLDLACGTGIYSNSLLSWGASEVLGVDISSAMIEVAKATTTSENVKFEVGDCTKPIMFGRGQYDLVVGAWLLNYAATKDEMTSMYRTIAMNLKDGGTFVGVTPHPTEDPKSFIQKASEVRPARLGEVNVSPSQKIPDGMSAHVKTVLDSGIVEFDAYHLRKSIYETSAREAGFSGTLVWKPVDLPDGKEEDPAMMRPAEYWQTYIDVPHFGILIVLKS